MRCISTLWISLNTDDAGMLANLFRIRGHRNYTGKVNVFTEDDILKLDELEFDVLETPDIQAVLFVSYAA